MGRDGEPLASAVFLWSIREQNERASERIQNPSLSVGHSELNDGIELFRHKSLHRKRTLFIEDPIAININEVPFLESGVIRDG